MTNRQTEPLPGLVRVAEERMGMAGRPLTTLMAFSVVMGVTAWGADMFISKLVAPFLSIFGIHADSEIVGSITILATVTLFIVATVILTILAVDWVKRRSAQPKMLEQERKIHELETELAEARRGTSNG